MSAFCAAAKQRYRIDNDLVPTKNRSGLPLKHLRCVQRKVSWSIDSENQGQNRRSFGGSALTRRISEFYTPNDQLPLTVDFKGLLQQRPKLGACIRISPKFFPDSNSRIGGLDGKANFF